MNAINSLQLPFDRVDLRRARVRRSTTIAALACLLAGTASARQGAGLGSVHDVPINSGVLIDTPGHFGRIEIGDVTGDLRADAVLMIGQQPVLLYGPGCYQSVASLPFTARDIAARNAEQLSVAHRHHRRHGFAPVGQGRERP
jgi:hypothetical protein